MGYFKLSGDEAVQRSNEKYKLVLIIVLVAYFLNSFINGLIAGGRWDLNQAIATADRFLKGKGFYYSAIEASTPYFPGVSFLSVLIGKFFYSWRDYILLAIASMIGMLFFYLLIRLGEKFSGNKWVSLIVITYFLYTAFANYKGYMKEFKADTFVLIMAVLIVRLIDSMEKKRELITWGRLLGLFFLAFLMDVSKQQALYIDVALGLYLLFAKTIDLNGKIKILGSLIFAGLADLAVIFSIPDIEIQAIDNVRDMPFWSLDDIIRQISACFMEHLVFFLLLFAFVILLLLKKIKLDSWSVKWLMIALVFGIGQTVGGMKTGGNAGNYEVGMINFLPFAAVAAAYLFDSYFAEEKKKNIIAAGAMAVVLMATVLAVYVGYAKIPKAVLKIQTDKEVSEYLSQNFEGETFMYYSDQYMQIARSTAIAGMDVYSTPSNCERYWDTRSQALKNQSYKYLYIEEEYFAQWDRSAEFYFNYKPHSAEYLEKYYELIEDPDMPESLQGQLYQAKAME